MGACSRASTLCGTAAADRRRMPADRQARHADRQDLLSERWGQTLFVKMTLGNINACRRPRDQWAQSRTVWCRSMRGFIQSTAEVPATNAQFVMTITAHAGNLPYLAVQL